MNSAAAFTHLQQLIAGYREDMIAMQRELVRRVAVGPDNHGPGEAEKADFLAAELENWASPSPTTRLRMTGWPGDGVPTWWPCCRAAGRKKSGS